MSKRSSGEPTGGPSRPQGHTAGQPRLESLLRLDVDDDPDQGSLLYQAVVGQDTTQLSSDGWLDRLDAIGLVKSRLAALEAVTIAGFDDSLRGVSADLGHRYPRPGDRDATPGERRWIAGDLRSVSDEIALTLGMHRGSATTRIHRSCELVHNFPATLAALSAGLLTERAAFTIVSELSVLDNLDDLRAAEAAILDWAGKHPLVDIKKACQREVARRSPAATDKAHQRAHDERSVRMYPDDIGRATLVHDHGAVDSSAIMTSLSRAAIRLRRQGDPRSMDQLRNDIALSRLLPRTKSANHDQAPATSACTDDVPPDDATGAPADDDIRRPDRDHQPSDHACADQAPDADEPPDDSAYDPLNDYDQPGDNPAHDQASSDDDATTSVGAEATVVIHATGAEVRALINGEVATGGEADHHGPIPQSVLRKYLLKALAQTLPPNLPTTATDTTNAEGRANTDATVASARGSSRVELQITDEPPPSNPDRYTPSPALDRYVRLRDRTCQFPGCNRPAEYTDLDHRVAFHAGGRTTAANLWCLCRHHHRLKHEGGWHVHPNPDGTHTWTSPTGRRYRNNPTYRSEDPPP